MRAALVISGGQKLLYDEPVGHRGHRQLVSPCAGWASRAPSKIHHVMGDVERAKVSIREMNQTDVEEERVWIGGI